MTPNMKPEDKAVAAAQDTNAAVTSAVTKNLEGLPAQPVTPQAYNPFIKMVDMALTAFKGDLPEFDVATLTATEPVAAFPPPVALAVSALKAAFDQLPEGKPYQFSLDQLADDAGLDDVGALIANASKDKKLITAITAPKAAPAPAAPPVPSKGDRAKAMMAETSGGKP